jgi:hypothetical protein
MALRSGLDRRSLLLAVLETVLVAVLVVDSRNELPPRVGRFRKMMAAAVVNRSNCPFDRTLLWQYTNGAKASVGLIVVVVVVVIIVAPNRAHNNNNNADGLGRTITN